jgi:hypothetical protein
MRFIESNKYDLSIFLQLEFWLEKSMRTFDFIGSTLLIPFINDGIYASNEFLYQYMRSIDIEFFSLGGGEKSFRELPKLMKRSIYGTKEYDSYLQHLHKQSKRLKCKIDEIEFEEDNEIYSIEW